MAVANHVGPGVTAVIALHLASSMFLDLKVFEKLLSLLISLYLLKHLMLVFPLLLCVQFVDIKHRSV